MANDGGVVLTLFLMAASIASAMFSCVLFYAREGHRSERGAKDKQRVMRLLSGFANLGNAAIHLVLVVYIKANETNTAAYWLKERELGGIEAPCALGAINLLVGASALRRSQNVGGSPMLSLGWNGFVVAAGTFVPDVWHRFLSEGLLEWPHVPVFVWFFIFFMELGAFATSATWWALSAREEGAKTA
ncbi:hypothetical protein ACHAWF_007812 [Thalassiosira exigua]